MVSAIAVRRGVLAGNNKLSGYAVFCQPDTRRRIHWQPDGSKMVAGLAISLSVDASELKHDLDRIEDGELELPTVSAVRIEVKGCKADFSEDVPVWLPAQ